MKKPSPSTESIADAGNTVEKLKNRLAALEKERAALLAELREAESRGVACDARQDAGITGGAESPTTMPGNACGDNNGENPALPGGDCACRLRERSPYMSSAEKVKMFLEMFGARRTVFPRFWKNPKTGASGYAPVCENEWRAGVCEKPRVKCHACPNRKFPALDAAQVEKHLRGREIFGVYAIREDDSCLFLAADFDGENWADDARAFIAAGEAFGVSPALERSRSGNGAHAWIFFAEPVPAMLARRLGTLLLARASAMRPSLNLESYDRFFPNQDFLPKGGFGNLIALPLAHTARIAGNTVFIAPATLTPFADQWAFLASVKKISRADLEKIFAQIGALPAVHPAFEFAKNVGAGDTLAGEDAETFALKCDELALSVAGGLPAEFSEKEKLTPGTEIFIEIGAMLDIDTIALPAWFIAALKRLATFPNPVFYEKQRLRFPTFNIPQFLFAGETKPGKLRLPRGARDRVEETAKAAGVRIRFSDTRPAALPAPPRKFLGTLRPEQNETVGILLRHECGVLVAPPGAGKTVIACALAARLQTRTLVLVHRKVLLEQWRAQIGKFLGLKKSEIGVVRKDGTVPERATARFDVAMLPSLARMASAEREKFFARYDLVFTDECHHVPAVTFEALLKNCVSRRVYGLTATLARKDKLERLLLLQCGPVRHEIVSAAPAAMQSRRAKIFETEFVMPETPGAHLLHEIWEKLVRDEKRNALIAGGIFEAMRERRFSLVLSDRKDHLEILSNIVAKEYPAQIFVISGEVGIRERRRVLEEIEKLRAAGLGAALFSTGSLAGEGLDLPRLDTLFLTMPVSFKGRLTQYAGRLHRDESAKNGVVIYDYLDVFVPVARAMWKRRFGVYPQFGYAIERLPECVSGANPLCLGANVDGTDSGEG